MVRIAALAAMVVIAAPSPARAEGELVWNPRLDGGIVIGGGFLWIVSETYLKTELAPDQCRWCDDNGLDRGWRDAMKWDDVELAHDLSNGAAFVAAPLSALGLGAVAAGMDGRFRDWPMDAVIILESMVLAIDVNQVFKLSFGRERPFVHALPPEDKPLTEHPDDNNVSFYSGHATFAFSLAVASGTIASMRRYRLAPLVWGVGLTAATATAWLRMAADKHYFTDVTVGALAGAAIGFWVPWIHRAKHRPPPVAPMPVRGGIGLGWTGTF